MSQEEPNAKKPRIATDSVENKLDDVSAMVAGIFSEDPSLQLESTIKFRRIVSLDMTPSTENLLQSGVVPRFIEFLDKKDSPKLQHEAAWAITNIATDKPELVTGAVPNLVKLLASPNYDVLEQAIWALCNVAGSSIQSRDIVLYCGALIPLCSKLNEDTTELSMLRIGTRTLLNLCRGTPSPLFDNVHLRTCLSLSLSVSFVCICPTLKHDSQVKGALPTVKRLLHSDDKEVLANACFALFYMINPSQAGIQSVIEAGFIPTLVQLLQHTSPHVFRPALVIICILTLNDNQQIQLVIDCGALPILATMLTQDHGSIIKQNTFLMIACITAGTKEQIQSVIDANLIPILVNVAQNAELDENKVAVWAISKAAKGGSDAQVKYLVEKSCIKPLCDNLVCDSLRVILACLDGLENILKVGEAEKNTRDHVNYYRQLIIDAEGKEKIEILKSQDHNEIKEKAVKIMQTYHDHNEIKGEAVKIMETYWPEEKDGKIQEPQSPPK